MNQTERQQYLTTEFFKRFGQSPTAFSRAPGRVDLMGSHTDYNHGYVMTMAIDRDTWIAARPRTDRQISIASLNMDGSSSFLLDDITYDNALPWTNYVRGVAGILQIAGNNLTGFDGLIHSTIPFGSGLSSSAALEVATATLFKLFNNLEIDSVGLALLCQRAENEFVGVNCGILDQYSSALGQAGRALLLDCRHLTAETLPLPENIRIVICDTRAKRALVGSEYGIRRAQCEEGARLLSKFYPGVTDLRDVSLAQFDEHEADLPETVAKRCRFIIQENQRVLNLADALSNNDLTALKSLTAESYLGARDLYQIGCPEMEAMMQAMTSAPGTIGARQTGAGFGGCLVALVDTYSLHPFTQHVRKEYTAATCIEPKVCPVHAAAGAGTITLA
ncbi:MAG: galactokinase [Deltaproteobacteria bacterium]|nr:galactokinase [Deltaproteobacteria bacterium]